MAYKKENSQPCLWVFLLQVLSLELPLYFAVGGSYVMFLNFVSVHLEKLCIASHMIWVDEPLVHNSYVDNCSRGINCYWFFCTYYSKQLWDKIQLPCCNSYWLLYMWDKLFESFQNVVLQVGSCKMDLNRSILWATHAVSKSTFHWFGKLSVIYWIVGVYYRVKTWLLVIHFFLEHL